MRDFPRVCFVALALSASIPLAVEAQWFQGAGYVAAGVSRTATGDLDDALAASAYPRFGPGATSVGIGAYMTVARRVMLGGEWTGLIKGSQEHLGRTVSLGGGYGTLGLGYAFHPSRRVRVYPRIGLGGGGLGMTFETTEDTVSFGDVLTNPDAEADASRGFEPTLTRSHALLDLGGGIEFLPSRSGRGTIVGVRFGYAMAPPTTEWEFHHRPVRNGPEATVAGAYIRMFIGAGARR